MCITLSTLIYTYINSLVNSLILSLHAHSDNHFNLSTELNFKLKQYYKMKQTVQACSDIWHFNWWKWRWLLTWQCVSAMTSSDRNSLGTSNLTRNRARYALFFSSGTRCSSQNKMGWTTGLLPITRPCRKLLLKQTNPTCTTSVGFSASCTSSFKHRCELVDNCSWGMGQIFLENAARSQKFWDCSYYKWHFGLNWEKTPLFIVLYWYCSFLIV